jgi:hypothetical protein
MKGVGDWWPADKAGSGEEGKNEEQEPKCDDIDGLVFLSWGLGMNGKDGLDDEGIQSHLFFLCKRSGRVWKKVGHETHARCLSREIGDLLQRKGDYAQALNEEGVGIPLCEIQTLVMVVHDAREWVDHRARYFERRHSRGMGEKDNEHWNTRKGSCADQNDTSITL